MVDRVRRVPPWAWLTVIVAGSIVFRAWLGSRMPAPFIFTDELQYQENARSLAAGAGIQVRDEAFGIVSVLYPLVLAPAYLLFDSLPDAYAAARTINAVVMSLAAIPAYLIARRLLPTGLSLFAALLAVALPSLAYTGTLMSENAFYPAFLLAAWALLRALDEPTLRRQLVLLAACGVVTLVRVQGLAVVLAALTAPLLLWLVARRPLRPWAPLYGIVAGGAVLVLGAQLARGAPISSLFGAYEVVGEESYDVVDVLKYVVWHLAELDLYVAVIPFAAFLLARGPNPLAGAPRAVLRRRHDRADGLDAAHRRRVRLALRRRDRRAEHVHARDAAPDRAARLDRPGRAEAACLCRRSRRASRRFCPR